MDVASETGEAAGRIYRSLGDMGGAAKLPEIKKKLKDKRFDYAVGWLLREGKISLDDGTVKLC